MADVFLSYSREDIARAEQVANGLTAAGLDVFWDNEIPPGTTWADYIEGKLNQCKALIVLWSEHSTKSQWVREEARMGRDKGVLIPVMIDGSQPPFGFGEVQAANLANWSGEADNPNWRRFIDAVMRATNAEPRPAPPVAPPLATPQPQAPPQQAWSTPAQPAPAEKKSLPVWVWVAGAVVATVVVLGIIGSMMPQTPQMAQTPPATTVQPPSGQPVGDQNWQQTLTTQLQQAQSVLGQQGYQLVGQPYSNSLQPGQSQDLPTDMTVGYEYQILGVCDADCSDLDIRVYGGDGALIVEDTSANNQPNVGIIPSTSGTFSIQVSMYACTVAPCFYAVQLYARPRR
jgi:hypothetical protein